MREIKFRAIDMGGRWVYGDLIHKRTSVGDAMVRCKNGIESDVDVASIGQYTGLKDKNGKEIFEGDIIRSFDSNDDAILHCIVWEEARFVALYKGRNFSSKCFLKQDWLDEFDKEVIGNIHDNPELVNKENLI